jgi:sterol desaturase/sphingolipid hydroxylase (fatty acid hydroxylase superfamily)
MDDLAFGTRNKRGDFAPKAALQLSALWAWPPRLGALARWAAGFVWPWNLFIVATTVLWWNLVVPDAGTLRNLSWGWVLTLLGANIAGIFCFYGAIEWRWYIRRAQERRFKYNSRFPAEQPSDVFRFKSQNLDNALRSFLVGVPIGTAIEVVLLWAYANGWAASVSWDGHAPYLVALALLVPLVHEVHFFFIHRAIHWGPLYRWVHSVHHNSVNPSPWSSLSMHPVEATAYFGVALWVLAVPAHPFIAVLFFHLAGFGAVVGHIGFDRLELGGERSTTSHAYAHYLHHKYFEVNYCDNGMVPLDHWFGSWHDGTPEGERRMQERFRRRAERANANAA